MSDDYRVEMYKRMTRERVSEACALDWAHCLEVARALAKLAPDHIVSAYNAALAEPDTDGLTDSQRDEMLKAVEEARREEVAHG